MNPPCEDCGYVGCKNKMFVVVLPADVEIAMNIPCRARSFFLEHQGVAITEQKTFEVTLAQLTVPTREFKVQCTNMANETYFEGAVWTSLVHRYQMQPAERCNFYLDEGTEEIYFM